MQFGIYAQGGVYDFSDASTEEQFGALILPSLASIMSFVLAGAVEKDSWSLSVGLIAGATDGRKVVLRAMPGQGGLQIGPQWLRRRVNAGTIPTCPHVSITVDGQTLRDEILQVLGPELGKMIAKGVLAYRSQEELRNDFPFPAELEFAGGDAEWQALL